MKAVPYDQRNEGYRKALYLGAPEGPLHAVINSCNPSVKVRTIRLVLKLTSHFSLLHLRQIHVACVMLVPIRAVWKLYF